MSKETVRSLGTVGGIVVGFVSLFATLPLKALVKAHLEGNRYFNEQLAGGIGMLASFIAFLVVVAVLLGPPVLIWNHYQNTQKKKVQEKPQQVTYGFQTPVPR